RKHQGQRHHDKADKWEVAANGFLATLARTEQRLEAAFPVRSTREEIAKSQAGQHREPCREVVGVVKCSREASSSRAVAPRQEPSLARQIFEQARERQESAERDERPD